MSLTGSGGSRRIRDSRIIVFTELGKKKFALNKEKIEDAGTATCFCIFLRRYSGLFIQLALLFGVPINTISGFQASSTVLPLLIAPLVPALRSHQNLSK